MIFSNVGIRDDNIPFNEEVLTSYERRTMFNTLNSAIHNFPGLAVIVGSTIGAVAGYTGGRTVGILTDENIPAILATYAGIALPTAGVITMALLKKNHNQELVDAIVAAYKH